MNPDLCYIVLYKSFKNLKVAPHEEYKPYVVVQSEERAEDIAWELQMTEHLAYVEKGRFEIK